MNSKLFLILVLFINSSITVGSDLQKVHDLLVKGKVEKAISVTNNIDDCTTKKNAHTAIADFYSNENKYVEAIEFYYKAIIDCDKTGEMETSGKYYNSLVYVIEILINNSHYTEADHYLNALNIDFYSLRMDFTYPEKIVEFNTLNKSVDKYYLELIDTYCLYDDYVYNDKKHYDVSPILDVINEKHANSIISNNDAFLYCIGNENTAFNENGALYFYQKGATENIIPAVLRFNKDLNELILNNHIFSQEECVNILNQYALRFKDIGVKNYRPDFNTIQETILSLLENIDKSHFDINWLHKASEYEHGRIINNIIERYSTELIKLDPTFSWIPKSIEGSGGSSFKVILNTFNKEVLQKGADIYSMLAHTDVSYSSRCYYFQKLNAEGFKYTLSAKDFAAIYPNCYCSDCDYEKLRTYSKADQNLIFYYMILYHEEGYAKWLYENTDIDISFKPNKDAPNVIELERLIYEYPIIADLTNSEIEKFEKNRNNSSPESLKYMMDKRIKIYSWILENVKIGLKEDEYDYMRINYFTNIIPNIILLNGFNINSYDINYRNALSKFLKRSDYFFGNIINNVEGVYDYNDLVNQYNSFLFKYCYDYITEHQLANEIDNNIMHSILLSYSYVTNGILNNRLHYSQVEEIAMNELIRVLKDKVDFNLNAPIYD
ncbi:hypothetical protein ACFLS4_03750 [Bacteroidota bacterium]